MYFILKTDDLKSKTNSRLKKKRPFSNKIEKIKSVEFRVHKISKPKNQKQKRRLVIAIYINLRM